jgi:predicted nucleic acid-binding Zn ribbon protein
LVSEPVARARRALAPPSLLAAVQERWAQAAGREVAANAEPVSERGGVVTISCRSATWAAELSMLAGDLLERLNEELAEGASVSSLKFETRPF